MVAGSGGVNGGGSVRVLRAEDARAGVLEWRRLSERAAIGGAEEARNVQPWRVLERETENSGESKWSCGEGKCGDEGERFGATSFKLNLFPHTLSMGVGIIGGKPEPWADHHIPHSIDLFSHVINSLMCEPFKPMD
jgi:hypothetical protein